MQGSSLGLREWRWRGALCRRMKVCCKSWILIVVTYHSFDAPLRRVGLVRYLSQVHVDFLAPVGTSSRQRILHTPAHDRARSTTLSPRPCPAYTARVSLARLSWGIGRTSLCASTATTGSRTSPVRRREGSEELQNPRGSGPVFHTDLSPQDALKFPSLTGTYADAHLSGEHPGLSRPCTSVERIFPRAISSAWGVHSTLRSSQVHNLSVLTVEELPFWQRRAASAAPTTSVSSPDFQRVHSLISNSDS
ncbi:hypothetical protein BD309DRAFT_515514 [Dichomitus squalens]|nr:hypothetical protein BD309DRAFT_515514 [Dichomitus squalens]